MRKKRLLTALLAMLVIIAVPLETGLAVEMVGGIGGSTGNSAEADVPDGAATGEENKRTEQVPSSETPSNNPEPTISTNPDQTMVPDDLDYGVDPELDPRYGSDSETPATSTFPQGVEAYGSTENLRFTGNQLLAIYNYIDTDISYARLNVVLTAYSLKGKVSYFWGGKSKADGWDTRWGNAAYVSSSGSSMSGTVRAYGLDCSGYVSWVFHNASGGDGTGVVGEGTSNQWAQSTAINWSEAKIGDLAFFAPPGVLSFNHVGIVVGKTNNGKLLIAHCSSGANNVVVTEAVSSGFRYIRRPAVYGNETFVNSAESIVKNNGYGYVLLWRYSVPVTASNAEFGDLAFTISPETDELWTGKVGFVLSNDVNGLEIANVDGENVLSQRAHIGNFTEYRRVTLRKS